MKVGFTELTGHPIGWVSGTFESSGEDNGQSRSWLVSPIKECPSLKEGRSTSGSIDTHSCWSRILPVKVFSFYFGFSFYLSLGCCPHQVSGYCGLLLGSPIILYELIAFVIPGLTRSERRFLGPIVLGSSVLFYTGLGFSYAILTPAALSFFVSYAEGVVESLWSIDQYFEFVLVLMFSTGLAFQVRTSLCSQFRTLAISFIWPLYHAFISMT